MVNAKQTEAFWRSEGDQWYARNAKALAEPGRAADDPVVALLAAETWSGPVVEVGASNGWRLAYLAAQRPGEYIAVEPSAKACAEGTAHFPAVRFVRALAHDLSAPNDASAGVVIVSFVLHWVDRNRLLRTYAELDRVLRADGLLLIADFLPDTPCRKPYHHLPGQGVFTYKQDYRGPLLASGLYREEASRLFGHAHGEAQTSDTRCVASCLRKIDPA